VVNVLYVAMYGQQSPALEIKRGGGIWSWETRARPYLPSLAALRHAVFTTLAMIAPVKPFISAAKSIKSTSLFRGLSRTCTFRICSRPSRVGACTVILRSKRPARTRALSKTSTLIVKKEMSVSYGQSVSGMW
jgi:hypothetical protein